MAFARRAVKWRKPVKNSAMANPFIWVYQYEIRDSREAHGYVPHTTYRTEESIRNRGGIVLAFTARQVPAVEVDSSGMWKPDRNPVA